MSARTNKTVEVLSQAARNQPGNQSELLKLITHVPSMTQKFLPYPIDSDSAEADDEGAGEMIQMVAKGHIDRLKQMVHFEEDGSLDLKAKNICGVLENLILLGGCEFAKKKLMDVLSHETYNLIQEGTVFVENLSENMGTVEKNISYSVSRVKMLAMTTMETLFLCEEMKLTYQEQATVVSSMILEKLSTELLMVVDSMKEALQLTTYPSNPVKQEDGSAESCFSSSHLVSLANVVDRFLDLEKSLKVNHNSILQKIRSKSELSKKSALKQRSKLPDILRSSQEASWIRSVNIFGDWDWQEVLKDVGPIIMKSITNTFDECETNELSAARNSISREEINPDIVTESLSSSILSGPRIPKKSLQYFNRVLRLMKYLLPYAVLGCHYRPLSGLASTYIDECSQVLKTMKSLLSLSLNDFPERITVSSLQSMLGTCEDVCAFLGHCAFNIDSEPRMAFQGTLQSYEDMIETIKNTVIQNLNSRMRGCILHDAEGDHFNDPKEFGEGESCSPSITNWKRILERLWKDLGECVSMNLKIEIFYEVLGSSLEVLDSRYLRCEPSYNRRKQLLFDLPTILSVCQDFVSEKAKPVMHYASFPNSVVARCASFKSVLCLVAGPLKTVEKILSSQSGISNIGVKECGPNHHGAAMITPCDDNSYKLALCLHSLLKEEYSLADRILSEEFSSKLDETMKWECHCDIFTILTQCPGLRADAFFHLAFSTVGNDPHKLLESFLPNVDGTFVYPWQKMIFNELGKILCQTVAPAVTFLCHPTWSSLALNVIENEEQLKGIVNVSQSNRTANRDGHITASVILLIQGLCQMMYLLPEWIIAFLTLTQSKLPTLTPVTCGSVLLHALISSLRRFLDDPSLWDQFSPMDFTKEGVEAMQYVSKIFASLCHKNFGNVDGLDNMKTHLENLCEEAENYLSMQKPGFDCSDEQLMEECKIHVANLLMDNNEVVSCLRRLRDVILSWPDSKSVTPKGHSHCVINLVTLDGDAGLDWEDMCKQALDTLDRENVKLLISHRWEMKKGASLNAEEAEIVARVKTELNLS